MSNVKLVDECFMALDQKQQNIDIQRALRSVSVRDVNIFIMRYLSSSEVITYEEIGSAFGITRERVRQICKRIIRKLNCPCYKLTQYK